MITDLLKALVYLGVSFTMVFVVCMLIKSGPSKNK